MTLQVNVLKFWKATQHSIFLTSTAPIIEYLSFCKLVINMKPNHASKTICLTFLLLQAEGFLEELTSCSQDLLLRAPSIRGVRHRTCQSPSRGPWFGAERNAGGSSISTRPKLMGLGQWMGSTGVRMPEHQFVSTKEEFQTTNKETRRCFLLAKSGTCFIVGSSNKAHRVTKPSKPNAECKNEKRPQPEFECAETLVCFSVHVYTCACVHLCVCWCIGSNAIERGLQD